MKTKTPAKTKAPAKPAKPAKAAPKPPTSYRLGIEREARFNAFKDSMGLKWSDAMHRLVDAGLQAFGFGVEAPAPAPEPKPRPKWDI